MLHKRSDVVEYGIDETAPDWLRSRLGSDHYELGRNLESKCELESVIVVAQTIDALFVDDPDYVVIESSAVCSEIEEEVRRRLGWNYFSYESAVEYLKADKRLRLVASTELRGEEADRANSKLLNDLVDRHFEAQVQSFFPETLDRRERRFKAWRKKKGLKVSGSSYRRAWEKRRLKLLSPRTSIDWRRKYSMPKPFCYWDSRNRWQQFYFMRHGDKTYWVRGGSCASGMREEHGRFAHAFAAVSRIRDDIPTFIYQYTSKNEFVLKHVKKTFVAVDQDLTGNYRGIDEVDSGILFHGRKIQVGDFL